MSFLRGVLLAVLTVAAFALALGFYGFSHTVSTAQPPFPMPQADAIVSLTGGSTERLETGLGLLREGRGRRLLISGVNPKVTENELEELLGADKKLFQCCVDLGRQAEDTIGNAAETAAWAERNGFSSLVVVTDDYHMPRSLAELRAAMPGTELIAYPVRTAEAEAWGSDVRTASRLALEYGKYLTIRLREALLALDRPAREDTPSA